MTERNGYYYSDLADDVAIRLTEYNDFLRMEFLRIDDLPEPDPIIQEPSREIGNAVHDVDLEKIFFVDELIRGNGRVVSIENIIQYLGDEPEECDIRRDVVISEEQTLSYFAADANFCNYPGYLYCEDGTITWSNGSQSGNIYFAWYPTEGLPMKDVTAIENELILNRGYSLYLTEDDYPVLHSDEGAAFFYMVNDYLAYIIFSKYAE